MTTQTEQTEQRADEPLRVSNSALNLHRTCPQAYTYKYIRRIERDDPAQVKVELEMGNWWHALRAADSIDRGRALGSIKEVPEEIRTVDEGPTIDTEHQRGVILAEKVLEAAQTWWNGQDEMTRQEWESRIGQGLPERLAKMDALWRGMWSEQTKDELPLAVEFKWERRLPALSDGTDADAVEVGIIDEVYYSKSLGMVVIRDHKSHKAIPAGGTVEDMMDSQLQVYGWGASQQIASWGHGPVRAVAYDRIRMAAPKSPVLNLSGTLSRSVTDYDLQTYLDWVEQGQEYPGRKKDGSGAGVYTVETSVVERLSATEERARWTRRTLTPLNMNVVKTHVRSAIDSAVDTRRTRERVAEVGDAPRNFGSACKWCDFQELCRAEMLGGPGGEYDLAAMNLKQKEMK